MRIRTLLLFLVPTFALAVAAVACPELHEAVALSAAPAAVRTTVLGLVPPGAPAQVVRVAQGDSAVYEVTFERDGRAEGAKIAATGHLMEREREVGADGLPEPVIAAIARDFPGAEIEGADEVTVHYYEVILQADGRRLELEFLPSGGLDDDEDEDAEDED